MDFRVLGPLEVHHQDELLPLGGPRQRMVLAVLLSHVNEVVSTDRLIEDVWRGELADGARRTLQSYVSHLRRVLEDLSPGTLTSRPPGYILSVEGDGIDAHRFTRMVAEGRRLLDSDPGAATDRLWAALSMWRGSPFADLAGEPALRPEITRLE